MFYLKLLTYRLNRLRQKYLDMRRSSGSSLRAVLFVIHFVTRRFGYFWRHAKSRGAIAGLRADIAVRRKSSTPIVAFKIIGGIGDHIIAARLIRDLRAASEPFLFHVYSSDPGAAGWIFADAPGFAGAWSEFLFETLRRDYDVGVWVSHFVVVYLEEARRLRLRQSPLLYRALQAAVAFRAEIDAFVTSHPARDNELAHKAISMNYSRMSLGHGMLRIARGGDALPLGIDDRVLAAHRLERRGYITIHNGFDPNMVVIGNTSTKCYPRFADVVRAIKAAAIDLAIVQLGASTSARIDGVDRDLVGLTDLPGLAALLKHSAWHIDIESGLVHMARCFDVGGTVIFGPTPVDYFGYPGNQNIPPPSCGDCWWTRETWMARCPRGFDVPVCTTQDPDDIAREVLKGLSARHRPRPMRGVAAGASRGGGGLTLPDPVRHER
jgi:hypothetical protein